MRKRKKNKRPTPFTMPNEVLDKEHKQFRRTREHRKDQMKTVADQLPILMVSCVQCETKQESIKNYIIA